MRANVFLGFLLVLGLVKPTYGGWGTEVCPPVGGSGLRASSYRSQNFVVESPAEYFSKQVAEVAEKTRKEQAIAWLGYELPNWPTPCPVKVTIAQHSGGGATSFAFDKGRLLGMSMKVEGTTDKVLQCVIPHEVTHTIFATYFESPVPRWADEGGSVCDETREERVKHDQMCRQILNTPGRMMPLTRLFALKEYPQDVMVLYAEGFSVTNYLLNLKGKKKFLGFLLHAQSRGWDEALRVGYDINTVPELEQRWLKTLSDTKGNGQALIDPSPQEGVRVAVAPTVQPTVASSVEPGKDVKELLELSRQMNQKLEVIARLQADVDDLKNRTAKNERDIQELKGQRGGSNPGGGVISDIPGWSQPRANPYARPTASPPSGSPFVQPFNPNCPDGKCPNLPK